MLNHIWRQLTCPVKKRVQAIMLCELTPQKLALTFCIGIAIGIIPLVWGTSLLCIVLAYAFRLNQIALQSVNFLLWPVHLALLVPFFKLGVWLFPWGPPLPQHIFANPARDFGRSSLSIIGWTTLKALAVWMATVLPAALLAYLILSAVIARKSTPPSGLLNDI
jgi:uncharacterized protein (DUF2062 family)